MTTQWFLFVVPAFLGYIGISWFAYLTSGSHDNPVDVMWSALKPLPLVVMIVSNVLISLGMYFGLGFTRFAIPAAISIGVITSFIFSFMFLGAGITLTKIVGVVVIVLGVAVLAL